MDHELVDPCGDYATTGQPVFAPVDSRSFYVVGYFEETKLRHIREERLPESRFTAAQKRYRVTLAA